MDLFTFLETEYIPENLLDCEKETLVQHRVAIKHFSRFVSYQSGKTRCAETSDFTNANIRQFAAWMLDIDKAKGDRRRSPATVNKTRTHLSALWRYAHQQGMASEPPQFKRIKEPQKEPDSFSSEEIAAIYRTIDNLFGYVDGIPCRIFWRALIMFLCDTGARINVTMNVEPADIDMKRRTVRLPFDDQKTDKDQIVMISEPTCELIRKFYDPREQWVFRWPHDRYENTKWTSLHRYFKAILIGAGIDTTKRTFHRIRVTTGTIVADKFGLSAAQELLGHVNPRTTKKSYVDRRKLTTQRNYADAVQSTLASASA